MQLYIYALILYKTYRHIKKIKFCNKIYLIIQIKNDLLKCIITWTLYNFITLYIIIIA